MNIPNLTSCSHSGVGCVLSDFRVGLKRTASFAPCPEARGLVSISTPFAKAVSFPKVLRFMCRLPLVSVPALGLFVGILFPEQLKRTDLPRPLDQAAVPHRILAVFTRGPDRALWMPPAPGRRRRHLTSHRNSI